MRNLLYAVKLISAAALVLTVIVFVPISSQAATVIFDPANSTKATGINNLDIGGTFYNVAFTANEATARQVYGPFPGAFDFDTEGAASDAADAVNAALNAADARTVGAEGSGGLPIYRIGFDSGTVPPFDNQYVLFWENAKDDPLQAVDTDPWVRVPDPDVDSYPFGVRIWAKFTEVSGPTAPVTIGGNVTGLEGSGLVLQNNGGDDEPITANGGFTFATPLAPGSTYNVTVKTQPSNPAQTCSVANGSGTVPNEDVTNVAVTCADQQPPVGATVIFDPANSTKAIGIKNLDIGGTLYNVAFTANETAASQVYGPFPGAFDFDTEGAASDAADAVNAALNDFDARTVGAEGSGGLPIYRIGFDSGTVPPFDNQYVLFWENAKDDPLQAVDTDPWVRVPDPDVDSYPFGVRIWAEFSLASTNTGFLPAVYLLLLLTPNGS